MNPGQNNKKSGTFVTRSDSLELPYMPAYPEPSLQLLIRRFRGALTSALQLNQDSYVARFDAALPLAATASGF